MRARFALPLLLLFALPLHAWTPAGDSKIARKAAALAPPDMRLLIEEFDGDFRAGLERAQAEEGGITHRYGVADRDGKLREKIVAETNTIVSMIRKGDSMRSVVERLGGLAHFVADANNPFNVGAIDPAIRSSQTDYERFFENRLTRFPTVFYGLDPAFRLTPYLDRTFTRTAKFAPLLNEEYTRGGVRRSSSEFDDRSTAFGVASVCYSRAVTDLVNLYFHIWREAGGDVRAERVLRGGNLGSIQ